MRTCFTRNKKNISWKRIIVIDTYIHIWRLPDNCFIAENYNRNGIDLNTNNVPRETKKDKH